VKFAIVLARLRSASFMRIVSLLPSATEILYALGLGESVVGVTHECDFPPEAARNPALIKPRVDPHAPPAEIDRQVSDLVRRGESIYAIDAGLLAALKPDLIVTQDLCHVCAASPDDLATALARFQNPPRVLTLTPHSLEDVWQDIERVGYATKMSKAAEALSTQLRRRVACTASAVARVTHRPRVLCLEWLEPLYVAGHWVPEMVSRAGGNDVLGLSGKPSFRVTANEVSDTDAEVILIMLCGYSAAKNAAQFSAMPLPQSWTRLPALRERKIFALDANGYFSRPGPRLAEGVEILAHIFHPGLFSAALPIAACAKL
jgi:iron complex transport system substrate-binding protein